MLQIAHNAVTAKLVNADKQARLYVQNLLSYIPDGQVDSSWSGSASFYNFNTDTFPAGFARHVQKALISKGYKVGIVAHPLPAPLGPEKPVVDTFGYDPKYDYQPEVMDRLTRFGQIIAQVATGGGKSRIAKMCFARINRPTLFLTTRGVLMHQMKDAFETDMGMRVSVFGDGEWGYTNDAGKSVLTKFSVGMVQTFASRLEETTAQIEYDRAISLMDTKDLSEADKLATQMKKEGHSAATIRAATNSLIIERRSQRPDREVLKAKCKAKAERQAQLRANTINLLNRFEFVILEEAHEVSGNGFYEVLKHCKSANYRMSLTATPFMKGSEEANMRLMAVSGQVAIQVSEELLISRGILAKPIFKFAELPDKPEDLHRSTPWQRAYKNGVVNNPYRNEQIVTESVRAASYGLPVMLLVQHKEHGENLQRMLEAQGLRAAFIFGEHEQAERKAMLQKLRDGHIDALIGSTILDVGVDVPSVGFVGLCGGGKAEVALRQRIGRGLRAKKFGPNMVFILDFSDDYNTHLRGHARTRQIIIESTPGFKENILPKGADFDYEGVGFTRKLAA